MFDVLAATFVLSGMSSRPDALTGADGPAGYVQKLGEHLQSSRGFQAMRAIDFPGCNTFTYASLGYREFSPLDIPGSDIYADMAIRPAIFEAFSVTGCGTTMDFSILAFRAKADNNLTFGSLAAGDSGAGFTLKKDTFVSMNAMVAAFYRQKHPDAPPQPITALIVDAQKRPADGVTQNEIWTEYYCGYLYKADVSYSPGPGGATSINVKVEDFEQASDFRLTTPAAK